MAHFGGQPFDAAGDHAQRGKEHGVAVARDDLGGNRLNRQAQLLRHIFLNLRIDIGEGADRARNGASGDIGARRHQPGAATVELGIGLRELDAKGGWLGVDAVAAAHSGGEFVLQGAAFDGGEQGIHVGQQDIGRARQLHGEAGIEHVAAGHALVHEARFGADLLRHPIEEGDHVVLGDGLNGVDGGDVDGGLRCPPVPQRLGGALRHDTEISQLLGGMRLDLEPDAEAGFRFPDGNHVGAGIAGDHAQASLMCGAPSM